MNVKSKFLIFLLASTHTSTLISFPIYAMEGQNHEEFPRTSLTKGRSPAAKPSLSKKDLGLSVLEFLEAAEFSGVDSITPHHVLNRRLLLGNSLGNYSKKDRAALAEIGISHFVKENDKEKNPFLERAGLYKPCLEKAALYGDVSAMIFLGNFYKIQAKNFQALQWYSLAFQSTWENTREFHTQATNLIKELDTPEARAFLKGVPLYKNQKKNVEAFLAIAQALETRQLEPYLSAEERALKAAAFKLHLFDAFADARRFIGEQFLQGFIGKDFSQNIRMKRAAQLLSEESDPKSLHTLGYMLSQRMIVLEDLASIHVLHQLLKRMGIEDASSLTEFSLAGSLFVETGIPDALINFGVMLYENEVSLDELKRIGLVKKLKIKKSSSLTSNGLAATLFTRVGNPDALYNLGLLLYKEKCTLEEWRKISVLQPLLKSLQLRDSRSLTPSKLATYLYAKSGLPGAIHDLAGLVDEGKMTPNELEEMGILEQFNIEMSSFYTSSGLAAILNERAGTPMALGSIGVMLYKQRTSLEELHNIGVLPRIIKRLGMDEPFSFTENELAAFLNARIENPVTYFNIGCMLLRKKITPKELEKIGVLSQLTSWLRIKGVSSLTNSQLAALVYERAGTAEALDNLSAMLYEPRITLEALQKIGLLPRLLHRLGLDEASSLTSFQLAALLCNRDGSPNNLNGLGYMLETQKITLNELEQIGVLPRLIEELELENISSLTSLQLAKLLYEKSRTSHASYNLGLLYLSGMLELSEEEQIQKAEECFRESNLSAAKYKLAHMYMSDQLGKSLEMTRRCQKAIVLLKTSLLDGFDQEIEDYLGEIKELFHLEQKKTESLKTLKEAQGGSAEKEKTSETVSQLISLPEINKLKISEEIPKQELANLRPALIAPKKEKKIEGGKKGIKEKGILKINRKVQALKERVKQGIDALNKPLTLISSKSEPSNIEIVFESKEAEQQYENLMCSEYHSKAKELLQDIFKKPWGTEGAGKPELLKGPLKGWISRRISDEHRLVYRFEHGNIIIRSCKGHYEK